MARLDSPKAPLIGLPQTSQPMPAMPPTRTRARGVETGHVCCDVEQRRMPSSTPWPAALCFDKAGTCGYRPGELSSCQVQSILCLPPELLYRLCLSFVHIDCIRLSTPTSTYTLKHQQRFIFLHHGSRYRNHCRLRGLYSGSRCRAPV